MGKIKNICICTVKIPFVYGGAEMLAEKLKQALVKQGFEVELIAIPFKYFPKERLLKEMLLWNLIDLSESPNDSIDMVIPLKFPAYLIEHPCKVTWLLHQHRELYEFCGTEFSNFKGSCIDDAIRKAIHHADTKSLGSSKKIYALSRRVCQRLKHFNALDSQPLHSPPPLIGQYYHKEYGDYILFVSRLEGNKRPGLAIEAASHLKSPIKIKIAGRGPLQEKLKKKAKELGVSDRVQFLGYVEPRELLSLYANALGVLFVPVDEDYGYITLEAFHSLKPVISCRDSGAVLELVKDKQSGFIVEPQASQLAECMERLYADKSRASELGAAGYESVRHFTWEHVVEKLLEGAGA